MNPSHQRRDQERQALRQQILDVARRLFALEGFAKVTMRRIAQEIGYSATAIYLHFPDKRQLLAEICQGDFRALRVRMEAACAVVDPIDRLRAMARTYVEFALEHPHHYRMMFMTPYSDADQQAMVDSSAERPGNPDEDGYTLWVNMVQVAIAAGRLRPAYQDAHAVVQLLNAGLHGVIALRLDKPNDHWVPWLPISRQIDNMIQALMDGITLPQVRP
jgi:AcrR family transcriptional regulator